MMFMNAVLLEQLIERCTSGSLDDAILLATVGHYGQRDKGGSPYILHPLAVMRRVARFGVDTQVVGVLHDLVEDNPFFTYDHLRRCGFGDETIEALSYLQRPKGVTILDKANEMAALDIERPAVVMAMRVKIADYHENSDLTRIPDPTQRDIDRKLLYLQALKIVGLALSKAS